MTAEREAAGASQDFHPAAWKELLDLFGHSGVAEITAALAGDVPNQARRHAEAAAAGDLAALKHVAHALRGACLQLGAGALAELCDRVEAACIANDRGAALRLSVDALARYTALVERLVRETRAVRG